jgi:hypothetical protein
MKKSFLILLIVVGLFLLFSITPIPINATTIITDPSGDANPYIHDILSISGGFDSSNLYLEATFQPGTFNPSNLGFLWGLDTDLDSGTGGQGVVLGADFTIFFDWLKITTRALVVKHDGGITVGTVPVSFGSNSLSLTVPLSLLDNDDGVALFSLAVGTPVDADHFSITDSVLMGGPTTPVPEPTTMLLLGSGLIGLVGYGRKKFFKK